MHNNVGIYVRISDDRLGDAAGVGRQEKDCRVIATRHGWDVPKAHVYRENDTSAFKRRVVTLPDGSRARRVVRPEYRRMLDDLASGRITGIIAYDLDRIARDPRDLEDLIEVVEERGIGDRVVTATAGKIDLSHSNGISMARIAVTIANQSSRDTARRVRVKLADNAARGRHHGGARPYGWDRVIGDDGVTALVVNEDEAAVVRAATDRVIAGDSIKAIVRNLNDAGTVNSMGKEWTHMTARSMILRPMNAGYRVHGDDPLVDGTTWERIVDRGAWDAARVILTDPARRTSPVQAERRSHLLSGIAVCGVCGGPIRVGKGSTRNGVSKSVYRCNGRTGDGRVSACVVRVQAGVDEYVTDLVVGRLARADATELLRRDDTDDHAAARDALEALKERARIAAIDYADGAMTRDQFAAFNKRSTANIEAAEARVPAPRPNTTALADLVAAPDAAAAWNAADIAVRRAIVDAVLSVTILPGRRGSKGFDKTAVRIEWRS